MSSWNTLKNNNNNLPAVIPHFGDQSMAATWSKELQVSRMAGPCRSSTLWRATWGRDDERPRLSWTRTKPSAPSPRFQGWLTLSKSLNTCHWRWEHTYNSRVCFDPLFRLGCPGFTKPEYRPTPVEKGVSKSLFFPDEAINHHPRFR